MALGAAAVATTLLLWTLWSGGQERTAWAQSLGGGPGISDVSAMCRESGITAQVMFGQNFAGKIYSARYGTTHDCVYFNLKDMNMILFDIPNFACGTRLSRTGDGRVARIENEVYVQFDKDTQSADDKRFLFVCELIRNSNSIDGGVVNPSQTVVVQTIEPTRILITQEGGGGNLGAETVTMSIRKGAGPFQEPVSGPLQLGDPITLRVSTNPAAGQLNIFVHSCFATDGGAARVELIDREGCSLRDRLVGPMARRRQVAETIYYFTMSAFKFPASDDVYFSCSVDVCRDCAFAEICPGGGSRQRRGANETAALAARMMQPPDADFEEVSLHESVRFRAPEAEAAELRLRAAAAAQGNLCLSHVAVSAIAASFALTLISLIAALVILYLTLKRGQAKVLRGRSGLNGIPPGLGNWSPYKPSSYARSTLSTASTLE